MMVNEGLRSATDHSNSEALGAWLSRRDEIS
jgi:hypothetical protein